MKSVLQAEDTEGERDKLFLFQHCLFLIQYSAEN